MRAFELKVPPPVVALAAGLLMWGLAQWAPVIEGARSARSVIALALMGVAVALDASALVCFYRARTTFNPLNPKASSRLVRAGPYRLTRNPMYLGLATMLVAWTIYLGSLPALVGLAFFVAYIDRFQIRPEERVLSRLFGQEFADYCKEVRRWL